jgi:hypothetical protein
MTNESLRDQMTPISEEEIDKKIDDFINKAIPYVQRLYPGSFDGENDIKDFFKKYKDKIIKLLQNSSKEWENVARTIVREKPIEVENMEIVHYGHKEDEGYFLIVKDKNGNKYSTFLEKMKS